MPQWINASQLATLVDRGDEAASGWRRPVYRDLAERIRLLVVDGQLPDGARVPSERDLAGALGLSRTTVTASYARLRDVGVLVSRRGAGNFARQPEGGLASSLLPVPVSGEEDSPLVALNTASSTAPSGLSRAYAAAAERLPALLAGTGYFPDGVEELRTVLADWFTGRGVPTTADQMIITVGSLSAWNVILQALAEPGDPVLLESPTYYNAIEACRRLGNRLVPFPITPTSWDPDRLEAILGRSRPRLAFLVPEFQNPTGIWLDEHRRLAAAAALRRYRTTTVIDETLVELILDRSAPRTPMAALVEDAITIGSASKSFWGGLRIGWIRSPQGYVRRLIETQSGLDNGAAPYEQLVTAELFGQRQQVLEFQRNRIRAQRDHLFGLMAERLPQWQATAPAGGLSLWYRIPAESSQLLTAVARKHGLVLSPGPRFYPRGGGRRQVRIPYVADLPVLTEAVRRLALAWEETSSGVTEAPAARTAELIV